jgi:hypothetical protein
MCSSGYSEQAFVSRELQETWLEVAAARHAQLEHRPGGAWRRSVGLPGLRIQTPLLRATCGAWVCP